jgi:hypothetical protein
VFGQDGQHADADAHDDGHDGNEYADNSRIHDRLLQLSVVYAAGSSCRIRQPSWFANGTERVAVHRAARSTGRTSDPAGTVAIAPETAESGQPTIHEKHGDPQRDGLLRSIRRAGIDASSYQRQTKGQL